MASTTHEQEPNPPEPRKDDADDVDDVVDSPSTRKRKHLNALKAAAKKRKREELRTNDPQLYKEIKRKDRRAYRAKQAAKKGTAAGDTPGIDASLLALASLLA